MEEKQNIEFVDLGLSVKWAKCNLGAKNEQDYGKYYAWGDATGYVGDDVSGKFSQPWYNEQGLRVISADLTAAQDAATVALGVGYRMPTKAEFEELLTLDYELANVDGINGIKFFGNGNSIFIPFAGLAYEGSIGDNCRGSYTWSSSVHDSDYAWTFYCDYTGTANVNYRGRCCGFSVRPVCDK